MIPVDTTPQPESADSDTSHWETTLNHAWELWFGPELKKRKEAGSLPDDFSLYMGQVLFPPKGENQVLLNEEVRGVGLIRAPRDVKEGDPFFVSDLAHLETYDLPDDLLDCGHFTIIKHADGWKLMFNFLTGRAKAKDMLELARQFLGASRHCTSQGYAGPAVDNLFSAAELTSKAELILHRGMPVDSKTHGVVASAINAWAKLGNIDAAFVGLFNRLAQQRPFARYGSADSRSAMPSEDDLELVQAMIDRELTYTMKTTERQRHE